MDTKGQIVSHEDAMGRIERRVRRIERALRWQIKMVLGRPRTILIESRWRLGDEVMALPIYQALKECWPESRLHVLCNYPDLLIGNPYVDVVNEVPAAPDRYILLRGAPRTSNRIVHLATVAGVPVPRHVPTLHYSDWRVLGQNQDLLPTGPFVAVAAGATWPTKRWPTDRWRTLVAGIERLGYAVVELGEGHEPVGNGTNLVGRTTVREAACVLHAARLLVCSDTGLMHLSLAAGTPVVALFGPTRTDILFADEPRLMPVVNGRPCQGCWNTAGHTAAPGVCPLSEPACLATIEVGDVLARIQELLGRGA